MQRSGPDFLCIGMSRAGTGWLYDQLRGHPDFWMPPIKELGYFDDGRSYSPGERLQKKASLLYDKFTGPRRREGRRGTEPRDMDFLGRARTGPDGRDVYAFYKELFDLKGTQMAGDITPAYSALRGKSVAGIAANLPGIRAILLMREPIERCWSQLCLKGRGGRMEEAELAHWPSIKAYITQRHVAARCFPSKIYDRWLDNLPAGQFRHYFFDDIVAKPDDVRTAILTFIGADPAKRIELPPGFNRKSGQYKPKMTDEVRKRLVDHFADELATCAKKFGGPAAAWPARWGL